jgi:hypothetical protein
VADEYYSAGNEFSSSATINTSGQTNAAPAAVYQTVRWNASFNYTLPGLTAGASYVVRLHFVELSFTASGSRVFNVAINGTSVLSNFDIYAQVGENHALVEQFNATANSSGQIVVAFTQGSADNPSVAGIEVWTPASAPSAPTGLAATGGYGLVDLSWSSSAGATSYNVYRGTSSGGEGSTPIATGITATNYTDATVADGTTYYYKVAAVNSGGTSGLSNEASAVSTATATVGATTPFVTYEAEAGTLGGGASIVSLTSVPTTEFSSPQLEASGHAYVQLTGTGQSVQWTNNTSMNVSAVNIRVCIPDSAGGGGINSTIDLYVNGVLRQAVAVSSTQTWVYETSSSYDGMSQTPSAGNPHVFWDESRTFISGAAVAPGSTIMLKMDSANNAQFYYIDCIDLEAPPAALSQPANTLSIVSYGAQPNNASFDNSSAINNCMSAAKSQGVGVWIPSGTWYCTSGTVLNATDVTIYGAGPWYSTILDTSTSWSNGFFFLATSASFQDLCIDATQPDATPGLFAVLGYGDNWSLNNVWARHTMLTWADGSNVTVENCRVNNSWGDGMNINNVNGTACNNILVMNNFARGNGDDGITLNSSDQSAPVMTNCTYKNNTSVASWWANEMGIYGGSNVVVQNNLLQDSVKLNGLEVGVFGNGTGGNGDFLLSAVVVGNTILRGGSFGYGDRNAGIQLGGGPQWTSPVVQDVVLSSNTIIDAMFDGIDLYTGSGMVVQYNTITSPGGNGIGVNTGGQLAKGDTTVIQNTVTGLQSGESALVNTDADMQIITGTAASAYNSENSVQTEACSEGGLDVGFLSNGSYTEYNSVNLNSVSTFTARVASVSSGGTIAIHLDSPTGTLIGTCSVTNTGANQTWATTTCSLSGASGTHNLYLVYSGGFNIEWFSVK